MTPEELDKLISLRNKATHHAVEMDDLLEQEDDLIKAAYNRGRRDAYVQMTNEVNESINE